MSRLRPRLTYANVVATLALVLAVGGGSAFAVVAANQVNSASIIDGQVKNPDLAANSIGGGKIIDHSLTGNDLAAGAVGPDALADGAVGPAKLADGAVGNAKLADGAISTGKLDNHVVTNDKIALEAIRDADVALGTLSGQRLAPETLTNREIASGAVHGAELAPVAVSTSKIVPKAVSHSKIADQAVGTNQLDQLPGVRLHRSTTQTIPSNAPTAFVGFDQEVYDPANMHASSSSLVTIRESGRYLITSDETLAGSGDAQLDIVLGNTSIATTSMPLVSNAGRSPSVSTVDALHAGDQIRLMVVCGSGCSSVVGASDEPVLALEWLGPS